MKINKYYGIAIFMFLVIFAYSAFVSYSDNYQLMVDETKAIMKYSNEVTSKDIHSNVDMLNKAIRGRNQVTDDGYSLMLKNYLKRDENAVSVIVCGNTSDEPGPLMFKGIDALEDAFTIQMKVDEEEMQQHESDEVFYFNFTYDEKNEQNIYIGFQMDGIGRDILDFAGGYQCLMTADGDFLLHPDERLLGLNIYRDTDRIMEILSSKPGGMEEIAVAMAENQNGEDFFHYNAYNMDKLGYASKVESLDLYLISVFSVSDIEKDAMLLTINSLKPIILASLFMLSILLVYIFRVKYTDDETGALNTFAFYALADKKLKRRGDDYAIGILSIHDVIDNQSHTMIYMPDVYKDITRHLKEEKGEYDYFFRLSHNVYAFIKKIDSDSDQQFNQFAKTLREEIQGTKYKSFALRSKFLETKFNIHENYHENILDDLTKYLMLQKETASYKYVDNYMEILYNLRKGDRLKTYINKAIAENRIVPLFQPILNLGDGRIEKYEVSVNIEEDKFYMPFETIEGEIEKLGLISPIDDIIIEKIGLYSYLYSLNANEALHLNINLSRREINREFIEMMIGQFEKFKINPEAITFEMTDTLAFKDDEVIIDVINRLHEIGCKIAIDNFGKSYFDIEQLAYIKADYLKLSADLVSNMIHSEKDRYVLNSLITAAKRYGLKTIAMSVDNEEILHALYDMGVDYIQGAHIGEPRIDVVGYEIGNIQLPLI